jgi:hypothetical protein
MLRLREELTARLVFHVVDFSNGLLRDVRVFLIAQSTNDKGLHDLIRKIEIEENRVGVCASELKIL